MSNMTCPTVRIKSSDPKSQGAFIEINETDFDPKKHTLYKGIASDDMPAPPAPVAVVGPNATDKAVELANDAGIDLSTIKGTGRGGQITVKDVETAIENGSEE